MPHVPKSTQKPVKNLMADTQLTSDVIRVTSKQFHYPRVACESRCVVCLPIVETICALINCGGKDANNHQYIGALL